MSKTTSNKNAYGQKATELRSLSPLDTERIGSEMAKKVRPGDIICLIGRLGSGKTTFVKGFARGFGVKSPVRSSSFMLVNEYKGAKGIKIYHMDLYRLMKKDFEGLGLEEYLYGGKGVCVIEWADKIVRPVSAPFWEISFDWTGENSRAIAVRERTVIDESAGH